MNQLKRFFICFMLLFFHPLSYADCLSEGEQSCKNVLDAIYEEMGRPEMSDETAEKIDRALFIRPFDKQPALATNVNTSWVDFDKSIIGTVSCGSVDDVMSLRLRWRPDSELEILDPDEVLTAE